MASRKLQNPTILVLFGATGDLARRKILPSLYHLYKKGRLPEQFRVVGFSRKELSDEEFRSRVHEAVQAHENIEYEENVAHSFAEQFSYSQGEFGETQSYTRLSEVLGAIDNEWNTCASKLFYLAVPPQFYETVAHDLARSGLTLPCSDSEGWTRVIIEKPFGKDLETAQKLDRVFGELFKEEQIYRIDHYLGKQMVQNILTFRFSNNLFEQEWNSECIERIDIRLNETIDASDRGAFYDAVGALRDVGQNHLLQVLAFLTMEAPRNFTATEIREKRRNLLESIVQPTPDTVRKQTYRAQYSGFTETEGVAPDSETETYFLVQTELSNERWQGIPIVLEGGKALGEDRKEAVVTFRHPSVCLCPDPAARHFKNTITFRLGSNEQIAIRFLAKEPGLDFKTRVREFDFLLHEKESGDEHTDEYEKLLLDCIAGDQTLFVGTREVEAMWRLTDPIIRGWEANEVPLEPYEDGTTPDYNR